MGFEFTIESSMGMPQMRMFVIGQVKEGTVHLKDLVSVQCGTIQCVATVIGIEQFRKLLEEAKAGDRVAIILQLEQTEPQYADAWKNFQPEAGSRLVFREPQETHEEPALRDIQLLVDMAEDRPYRSLGQGVPVLLQVLKTMGRATEVIENDLREHGEQNEELYGGKNVAFFLSLRERILKLTAMVKEELKI